jgi:hypothetical protein
MLAGCGRDENPLVGPVVAGGLCNTREAYCQGDSELLACEGRLWTLQSCDELCAAGGLETLGCRLDRLGRDACACEPPDAGSACGSSVRHCLGPQTLFACGDAGEFEELSCEALCAREAPERRSAGCFHGMLGDDWCFCTLEGTPCTGAIASTCDGYATLMRCVNGIWEHEDCSARCGYTTPARCSSFGTDGADCVCEEATP